MLTVLTDKQIPMFRCEAVLADEPRHKKTYNIYANIAIITDIFLITLEKSISTPDTNKINYCKH